ncbi:DUF397 domain-containing protein [Actinacidiphila paucisporea]|uniref:DUF397 domain-containing protein n=1 Tax=Actinacidiphila paucisporea TaxID=310782 RepID=A0A1M6TQR8_9ACTN|nr:DUF397 domain-containing protein [Actinacidiphila paucisporea]SHK59239.1 protein of unknown function [Actinacidiphila paucisporea]
MTLKTSAGAGCVPEWTKSSYSGSNNNDCVEVAWVKSSYSTNDGPECVEVAASGGAILVRDSKDPEGPRFSFTPEAWSSFLAYAATREV